MVMKTINQGLLTAALLVLVSAQAVAFAPNNFFKPYDYNLRYQDAVKKDTPFSFGLNAEFGSSNTGKNWDNKTRNILALHEDSQSFLPALIQSNVPAVRAYAAVLAATPGALDDDGVRGHVALAGHFKMVDVTLRGRYILPLSVIPGTFAVSAALPVRDIKVSGVTAVDKTANNFPADTAVRAVTGSFDVLAAQLQTLGGLDWSNASSNGIGDLVVMFDWMNNYEQKKDGLENVQLLAKFGLSFPTAPERDENKAFSMARGNDGAWSLPFGMGLNLDFKYHVRLGLEAEFEVMFNHSKEFRMKTQDNQTHFMLLNKGRASMDYGLNWRFNLMAQAFQFWKGCSLGVTYEYFKHDDDRLTPRDNSFDVNVVNNATWLQESNSHHFIFKGMWDGSGYCCPLKRFTPHASVFYKLPLDGKNMVLAHTFGGQLGISF